jgi:hypothetical protein
MIVMLIKESQLLTKSNILDQLNEAVYLDESEATTQPVTIPVREMSRFGEGYTMVRFSDISRLAEDHSASYMDAVAAVAEASGVDAEKMTIAVDEADVIESPEILDELANVVVAPISETDVVYQLCEATIDEYVQSGDESILESLLSEAPAFGEGPLMGPVEGIKDKIWGLDHHLTTKKAGTRLVNVIRRNPTRAGIALAGTPVGPVLALYGGAKNVQRVYNKFKNRPRNVIAKKIAALRKLYEKWLHRAKIERDDKTAGIIKHVCTNIMLIIDKLLELMQKGANKLG